MEQTPNEREETEVGQGTPASPMVSNKDEPKKKMSKVKLIGLIIAGVIVWFIAVQFMAAESYEMLVNVKQEDNIMGVNPLAENLDFGDLSRNLGATRLITLKNNSQSDRYILVWKRGEIADMVLLNKNNFVLKTGEEVKLEFTIQIPPSAEPKQYKGKAVIFRWPKLF